mgnify:CR=1 FL=1
MRGKVFCRKKYTRLYEDHPRLCGEKDFPTVPILFLWGSPPPMRGKASKENFDGEDVEDHPRLCGEKLEPRE